MNSKLVRYFNAINSIFFFFYMVGLAAPVRRIFVPLFFLPFFFPFPFSSFESFREVALSKARARASPILAFGGGGTYPSGSGSLSEFLRALRESPEKIGTVSLLLVVEGARFRGALSQHVCKGWDA